ncbi:MAG TPA: hypothetical protein VK988_14070 [Acidimicrobiales bacterium]|nr:hypothetical protein [Acidimicrobiales bacterium]
MATTRTTRTTTKPVRVRFPNGTTRTVPVRIRRTVTVTTRRA